MSEQGELWPDQIHPRKMGKDEIALRAAVNVLRDSIESGRMPSGLPLDDATRAVHEAAAERIDGLIEAVYLCPWIFCADE